MRRKQYHRSTRAEQDKMVVLVGQGILYKHIAERFDVSMRTVAESVRRRRQEVLISGREK